MKYHIVTFIIGIVAGIGAMLVAQPEFTTIDNSAVCVEDMDCWDCATMGNLICGKV